LELALYEDTVNRIILGNEHFTSFWGNSSGWADVEAAELMSKSRLDWQVDLSNTLMLWDFKVEPTAGELILAWANLGSLVEGTLKLFLCVHYSDYKKDIDCIKKKGEVVDPDALTLEPLKVFFLKKEILKTEWFGFIQIIQERRNAIHAFKTRSIGSHKEFESSVNTYLKLMLELNSMMPTPFTMVF